jgi:1-acyl-sn-glycerol-3-phosphate acyltransferase
MLKLRIAASFCLLIGVTLVITFFNVISFGKARTFNHEVVAKVFCRWILYCLGVRVQFTDREKIRNICSTENVVFIANHQSTLDVLVICAIGLPRCRFFLTGLDRENPSIALIWAAAAQLGTFFTCPQRFPEKRVEIFRRAAAVLKETGDNVFLTPEGVRSSTGEILKFNKGAFHLAKDLNRRVVPLYFQTPDEVNPGLGFRPGQGVVSVEMMEPIDSANWSLNSLESTAEEVRQIYIQRRKKSKGTENFVGLHKAMQASAAINP